jgi:hypothetical protein
MTHGSTWHTFVGGALALTTLLAASPSEDRSVDRRPAFHGSISRIDPNLRRRMNSWHGGCPVPLRDLRLVRVTRWGFDSRAHRGRLIVERHQARGILHVMRVLYRHRYPIRRMRLVDAYGSDDHRSMAADNTSAFNCRFVAGTGRWSAHAYGLAIDLNPVENPYVSGGHVSPPAGARFADRSSQAPGVIHRHGFVVRAFRRIGWEWGGNWSSPKDYQHFSATGT